MQMGIKSLKKWLLLFSYFICYVRNSVGALVRFSGQYFHLSVFRQYTWPHTFFFLRELTMSLIQTLLALLSALIQDQPAVWKLNYTFNTSKCHSSGCTPSHKRQCKTLAKCCKVLPPPGSASSSHIYSLFLQFWSQQLCGFLSLNKW